MIDFSKAINLGGWKNPNSEIPLDIDAKLEKVFIDTDGEQAHFLLASAFGPEADIEVETFLKCPFNILTNESNSTVGPIDTEVTLWILFG